MKTFKQFYLHENPVVGAAAAVASRVIPYIAKNVSGLASRAGAASAGAASASSAIINKGKIGKPPSGKTGHTLGSGRPAAKVGYTKPGAETNALSAYAADINRTKKNRGVGK